MKTKYFLVCLVSAVVAVGLLVALPASAQFVPGKSFDGFRSIDQYQLELNGVVAHDARIYSAEGTPGILVLTSQLESPVVLWVQTRNVESLHLLKVAEDRAAGTVTILADPVFRSAGSFEVKNLGVMFGTENKTAKLSPKPHLLGLHGGAKLLEYSSTYAQRASGYKPSDEFLARLAKEGRDVRVRVFFGSWCPACGQMVPRVIKVDQQLAGSRIKFEYYGLPQGEAFASDEEAKAYNIKQVPSGVVFVDGREAGRISGSEWTQPERVLIETLQGS